jgi:hypothetical protein
VNLKGLEKMVLRLPGAGPVKVKGKERIWYDEIIMFTLYFKVLLIMEEIRLKRSIRGWIVFFIVALILSGCTAFALETELRWLLANWPWRVGGGLYQWVSKTYEALKDANIRYPFLAYGFDWLAFAHLVIAVAFIGVWRDPVRNKWIIVFGMIACIMVFPLAFFAGAVRGIPVYWRLIDCSFGVVGIIPLAICYRNVVRMERLATAWGRV